MTTYTLTAADSLLRASAMAITVFTYCCDGRDGL
jgi:hypothetical protein